MALNKPSAELLLDLINVNAPVDFVAEDLEFGTPEPMAAGAARNTAIQLSPAGDSGKLSMPTRVYYNRVALSALQSGALGVEDQGFDNTVDLLDEINLAYDIELAADDIVAEAIGAGAYPKAVTVKAAAGSLAFLGQLSVTINEPA